MPAQAGIQFHAEAAPPTTMIGTSGYRIWPMKRRCWLPTMRWSEPICLQRPTLRREWKRLRPVLLRIVVWGIALAALTHIVVVMYLPGIIATSVLIRTYAFAIFGLPAMLVCMMGVYAIVPRSISLNPKRVAIVHGQSVRAVEGSQIIDWRFATLPNATGDAVLRVTYFRKNGQRGRMIVGLGPKVELVQVDRALRRMIRLARWRTVRGRDIATGHSPALRR